MKDGIYFVHSNMNSLIKHLSNAMKLGFRMFKEHLDEFGMIF